MAHTIYVTRIHVEYQTKTSNLNFVMIIITTIMISKITRMTILVTFCLYSSSKKSL
jgi:hypothetical protein